MNGGLDYGAEEVMRYIFSNLRCVYDVRKAVLLAFLAQYEVGRRNVYELTCGGRPLARASFYIDCGVASDEVYDALGSGDFGRPPQELCTYAACYRAYPPLPELCYSGQAPQLPRPVEDRLSDVLEWFGSWGYQKLARYVDCLLWLNPWKLVDYEDDDIKQYLKDQGFRIVTVELCERTRRPKLPAQRRRKCYKYVFS